MFLAKHIDWKLEPFKAHPPQKILDEQFSDNKVNLCENKSDKSINPLPHRHNWVPLWGYSGTEYNKKPNQASQYEYTNEQEQKASQKFQFKKEVCTQNIFLSFCPQFPS